MREISEPRQLGGGKSLRSSPCCPCSAIFQPAGAAGGSGAWYVTAEQSWCSSLLFHAWKCCEGSSEQAAALSRNESNR